jgi:hypothetical protein
MTYTRLLLTWLLLAVLMPLNGIVREFGFKRVMTDATAEWLSALTGIALILAVTRAGFRIPAETSIARLFVWSVILVALTVAYEFGIGIAGGKSWSEMIANYAVWEGRMWPFVLAVLALTPWLWRGR